MSTQAGRDPNQGYTVAFWLLLGLAIAAIVGWLLVGLGAGWSTLGAGDLSGSAWQFLSLAATTGYVGAWLLRVILAASLLPDKRVKLTRRSTGGLTGGRRARDLSAVRSVAANGKALHGR